MVKEKAFELIAKARLRKKNKYNFLIEHGCTHDEATDFIHSENEVLSVVPVALPDLDEDKIKSVVKPTSMIIEVTGKPYSIEDLLCKCNVDTNIWKVDGYSLIETTSPKGDLNQIKVTLKKKLQADETKELIAFFKDSLNETLDPSRWNKVKGIEKSKDKKYCLELAVPDLHLDKLVHGEEVDDVNYDSNESIKIFKEAINDLIDKAPMSQVEKILFIVGNDFYHSDGSDNETTAGTKVDVDSRWQKTFKKGCLLLSETIEMLATKCEVDILIVSGNHDKERTFYLGEYLSAYFNRHPSVTINNNTTLRKYYKYGKNLIGFTHGHKENPKDLVSIMATEKPQDWADSKFREWHLGHFHKEMTNEYQGTKVRFLPSLCGIDAWHYEMGFIGAKRSALAFLYDKEKGVVANYYFNL